MDRQKITPEAYQKIQTKSRQMLRDCITSQILSFSGAKFSLAGIGSGIIFLGVLPKRWGLGCVLPLLALTTSGAIQDWQNARDHCLPKVKQYEQRAFEQALEQSKNTKN